MTTTLGRYQIEGRLGEGAMADVFRAQDPDIGRTVAIKVLKRQFASNPELGARFVREARAAGKLSHANIATVYDVGEVNDIAYIAMELVDGLPLDEWLNTHGRMPFERVLPLALQLADALAYAHRNGVVHRDVKPSNILISADGKIAKLVDFGVARVGDVDPFTLVQTQVGQLVGTPRYMSPEQALGLAVDARSDQFSLGAVLYEMLTGKPAFPGTGLAMLAIQIAQERVAPVGDVAPDCPPGFRFIIDKLLAKKPDQRFADGTSLVAAIEREVSADREGSSARRGLSLRVKIPLALFAVTALALVACVYTMLDRERRAFEHMAALSGNSIAAFVTENAGLAAADNAGLPATEQDWTALQAFVTAAVGRDDGVRAITVVDATGLVRAASEENRIGRDYREPEGEKVILNESDRHVTTVPDSGSGAGMRFVHPIEYAGARFGTVDIVLDRRSLDAAIAASKRLLAMLVAVVFAVVLLAGYLSAAMVARPLRKLRIALDDAAKGDFAFRISHKRRDEFGEAFEAFNRAAAAAEKRGSSPVEAAEASMSATRIAA